MYTLTEIKQQAQQLYKFLNTHEVPVSQSLCYEALAAMHGCRDWNTFRAKLVSQPPMQEPGVPLFKGAPDSTLNSFYIVLRSLIYKTKKWPPSKSAQVVWRHNHLVYVSEHQLRLELAQPQYSLSSPNRESPDFSNDCLVAAGTPAVVRTLTTIIKALKDSNQLITKAIPDDPVEDFLWVTSCGQTIVKDTLIMRLPASVSELISNSAPTEVLRPGTSTKLEWPFE